MKKRRWPVSFLCYARKNHDRVEQIADGFLVGETVAVNSNQTADQATRSTQIHRFSEQWTTTFVECEGTMMDLL